MRNTLIAKIHIAKKDLCLDEDTYRSIIKQVTKKESCSKCNERQLVEVLEFLKEKGWKGKDPKKAYRETKNDLVKKIYALWSDLQSRGAVCEKDKTALDKFISRFSNHRCVDDLDDGEAIKIIEILKQWIRRIENE